MRYRVVLVSNQKNNYVKIPADSALRTALNSSTVSKGLGAAAFSMN